MKSFAALAGLVLVSADWEDFQARYGKVYNGDDEAQHKATYEANMRKVAEQNAKDESLKFGENQFSDLTREEFIEAAGFGLRKPNELMDSLPDLGAHVHNGEALASSVDWRSQDAVTRVKDQGHCGSCWAFSAVASIESAWRIAGGPLTTLSEQQLIDCGNGGCSGSTPFFGMVTESSLEVASEDSYPYRGRQESCRYSGFSSVIPFGGISGIRRLNIAGMPSANDLNSAVQTQPVSVSLQADQDNFQHYKQGVISSGCGTNTNHAAVVVGYGTLVHQNSAGITISEAYWLIKNSWGETWGDHGYVRLSQNGNVCGVLSAPCYPVVSRSVAV